MMTNRIICLTHDAKQTQTGFFGKFRQIAETRIENNYQYETHLTFLHISPALRHAQEHAA